MAIFRGTGGSGNSTDDSIVSAVTEQAGIATTKASEAEGFRDEAEGFKNTASASANTATTKASEASSDAAGADSQRQLCVALRLETYDLAQDALASANAAEASAQTANNTHVQTVSGIATEVQNLDSIKTDITGVNTIKSDVTTVAGISSNVTTVAADASDIGTVATNISNVNNVGDNISNVNSVAGNASNINTVAADGTDIGTVASNISNVNTVAGISSDVTTVAGLESKMDTVIADASDIGAVAGNIGDVTTVAGINSDVDTVAGIAAKVTTVADNITDVQNADTNAANASASASQAANSETAASASATTATTKATEASNSATAASNSATTATTKASQAAGSATTATNKATEASTSATNAATSATTATTKAGEAASSASAASGSATTATNKAAEADASATSAASSATKSSNAASTWNNFYNSYLGVADAPPSVDVLGNPIVAGALYYDTGTGSNTVGLYVYNGSSWVYSTNYNNVTAPYSLAQDLSTNGNDISFGDNDKAKFGAGDDLQIYHDGSNSYVTDTGTGGLYLRGSNEIALRSSSNENIFLGLTDGSAYVYHNGSVKLQTTSTGIDVTGTVTASEGFAMGSGDQISSTGNMFIDIDSNNDSTAATLDLTRDGKTKKTARFAENGDISFYEDTGTTPKFFWDASAESLGIGTSSPSAALEVSGSAKITGNNQSLTVDQVSGSGGAGVILKSTGTNLPFVRWTDGTTNIAGMRADDSGRFYIQTNGFNNRLTIDSSGNVGIGTTSPAANLHVSSSGDTIARITSADGNGAFLDLGDASDPDGGRIVYDSGSNLALYTASTERMRIDASGNVGIGTTSPGAVLDVECAGGSGGRVRFGGTTTSAYSTHINVTNTGMELWAQSSVRGITFSTGTTQTERMRIDSSGNLLVGKTASSLNTTGIQLQNDGLLRATKSGADVLQLNRQSSDGAITTFYKDGSTVGSIGVVTSDNLYIQGNSSHHGLAFGSNSLVPFKNSAYVDSSCALGSSFYRFTDLHLSGGVHLGGTGTANKLDDYEEGTWTPTLIGSTGGSATMTVARNNYTKVGNMCTAYMYVNAVDTTGSFSGDVRIGGLPFAAGNNFEQAVTVTYCNLFNFDEADRTVSGYVSGTQIWLHNGSSNATVSTSNLNSASTGVTMLAVTYRTA